jgi:hypothetical protein
VGLLLCGHLQKIKYAVAVNTVSDLQQTEEVPMITVTKYLISKYPILVCAEQNSILHPLNTTKLKLHSNIKNIFIKNLLHLRIHVYKIRNT